MTHWPRLALAAAILGSCGSARAQEDDRDPWAPTPRHLAERMEDLANAEHELGPADREEMRRYWATHLRRCPLDGLQSAHYSMAELHLQRGNPKAALAALKAVLAATRDARVRNTTLLNLAEVCRRRLHDTTQASAFYRQITGPLAHRARRLTIDMLAEAGKAKEAVQQLEAFIAAAKEKGEKLALLHQLARLHTHLHAPEQALAAYQRVTTAITPRDIEQMLDAAAAEANQGIARIVRLRDRALWEQAEALERGLEERARTLREARRWDEYYRFVHTLDRGYQLLDEQIEQLERQEQQGEEPMDVEPAQGDDRGVLRFPRPPAGIMPT